MTSTDAVSPVQPLVDLLRELCVLVEPLGGGQYSAQPAGGMSGSIGGQVRHCVDHVAALVDSASSGIVCYDHRARGTAVETDRAAAVAVIDRLKTALEGLPPAVVAKRVRLTVLLAPSQSLETESTFGRELAFVLSHTVHHHAVIAWMLRELGLPCPAAFGIAPATAAYRANAPVSSPEALPWPTAPCQARNALASAGPM